MAIKPGENLAYLKDLIKRYENAVKAIQKTDDPSEVTRQERLIQPVLKEMQLAAPRVWDDFTRVSRKRREEIRDSI